MNLSAQFREYLLNQSNPASKVTVKNYVSDVNRFISWYQSKFNSPFDPTQINGNLIEAFKYESIQTYSASSIDRNLSSLRKFFAFLKNQSYISQNPFEAISNIVRENDIDPWRLKEFKNYLYLSKVSNLTIKNYIIDIKQFKDWLESTFPNSTETPVDPISLLYQVDSRLINDYKNRLLNVLHLSPVSVNRKLSSLRKYVAWATVQGLIKSNIQVLNEAKLNSPVFIPAPIDTAEEISETTSDSYSGFAPFRLAQKTGRGMSLILEAALVVPLASALSQINHATWVARGKPVFENAAGETLNLGASIVKPAEPIKNVPKAFYAPTQISTANFPTHMKIWYAVRYSRPGWYTKYHSYPFVSYLHLGILMIAVMGAAYILFTNAIIGANDKTSVLGTVSSSGPRLLTYQGKITDAKGQAINSKTNLRMSIYRTEVGSGSALLWEEVNPATPGPNGVFNVVLGTNNPIPPEIFLQNPSLYLGITVEASNELAPRQQIPTVELSESSETVQGFAPIATTKKTSNVILTLNSSGNLTIGGAASPTFQATGGTFTLSGKTLALTTTPESNGNIVMNPDGTGIVDIRKGIQNTSNSNSLVPSAVHIDDLLLLTGRSGSQAVLNINQELTGDLIIASVSGVTRFLVDNGGNIFSNGSFNGLEVSSGSIITGDWNAGLIGPAYGGTGLNTSASTGVPFISQGTWSIDSNSLAVNHGGTGMTGYTTGDLIYANGATSLGRLAIGGSGNCLTSNGSIPTWTSCGSASIVSNSKWTERLGSVFPNNATEDFLIGGDSTGSAKFAVINISSGIPTATLSGNLIVMNNNGSGGNSGFGTANPEARVQISGGGLCVGSDTDCNSDNNSEGVIYAASTATTVYDVAENYPTRDQTLTAGEVVAMDPERGIFVARNTKAYNPMAIGAISSSPGLLLGGFNGNQFKEEKQVPVALTGRIIIKASNENGSIKQGDFVTSAEAPGKIMKATKEGAVIGQALEDWDENQEGVMIFIKATNNNPYARITNTDDLTLIEFLEDQFAVLLNSEQIDRVGAYSDLVVARIKAGYLELGRLTVNTANIAIASIGELSVNSLAIASEDITIAGANIRDYIYSIVDTRISEKEVAISSPILETDMIKPTGKNIAIKLPSNNKDSKVEVLNASDSTVASIDAEGNASFSGQITSNGVQTSDASISGMLYAKRIIADQLDLSEEALARLQGIEISTSSSTINNSYVSNNYYYNSIDSASSSPNLANANSTNDIGSITAGYGTFTNGLTAFGTVNFSDVSVAERLFVGAQLSISGRSINVLGANLELQPLRQGGVSIAGGLVEIDPDGNLKVGGNAYFAKNLEINGKLLTGIIAPIPGRNLVFDFDTSNQVEFKTGSNSAVLSFSNKGDVNASGSGTFNKLNLSFIPKAIAVSDTEIIASGSAGTAEIKPYKNELTIKNPLVTKDSLIYITPKTSIPNQSVFLLRQVEGESFTVGISKAIEKSVPFNWILIN